MKSLCLLLLGRGFLLKIYRKSCLLSEKRNGVPAPFLFFAEKNVFEFVPF